MSIEKNFDVGFVARLTSEEKQIQQNYRPVIGVHKWFARRPGALFRSLLLSEFAGGAPLRENYYRSHCLDGVTVADPFMGGGTTLFESNRAGCNVVGFDINPLAYWIVRQELMAVDRVTFRAEAERVIRDVERDIDEFYRTSCQQCGQDAAVKYFLWVKQQRCAGCGQDIDLFPGYLVAENVRHPKFVFACPGCRNLVEVEKPSKDGSVQCPSCRCRFNWREGTASRNRYTCPACDHEGTYPAELRHDGPPRHRLFGIEYHCERCKPGHRGRFFKAPDAEDLARQRKALRVLREHSELALPDDRIPDGDETKRLHRWGYDQFREMFNERQLLALGLLLKRITQVADAPARHALATVFSDSLRYQNMLCRYDTYALKCQDIFSVHGFPVGLVQCENNVLGIAGVGSGSFRHFVEKYDRAKEYCEHPFETDKTARRKRLVPIVGERIDAQVVRSARGLRGKRKAFLKSGSIESVSIPDDSIDAVFTDPPYFDNVQYAELADFCFAWLRLLLADEFVEFRAKSTRSPKELTGNVTTGKDLAHFTAGLAAVFSKAARSLKRGGPFVFTYHHNDIEAYVPVVVAILDGGMQCTATLPCPAEMTASLHINGTGSSVVDTVIICRKPADGVRSIKLDRSRLKKWLLADRRALASGGIRTTAGDLYCLSLGHLARATVANLWRSWDGTLAVEAKMARVEARLRAEVTGCDMGQVVGEVLAADIPASDLGSEVLQAGLFDQV